MLRAVLLGFAEPSPAPSSSPLDLAPVVLELETIRASVVMGIAVLIFVGAIAIMLLFRR